MSSSHRLDPARAFRDALWIDIVLRAHACCMLPPRVLLHAGPPLLGAPPAPVLHAAIQAVLFEDWASDEQEARALITRRQVGFKPAQDYGVATPLAQVVSPSMPLVAVRVGGTVRYGAVVEGAPPALRVGSLAAACRDRLKRLARDLETHVAPDLRQTPIPLADPIRRGVAQGDEGHSRTSVVNAELIGALRRLDPRVGDALCAMSAFVLPILMAGAAAALADFRNDVAGIGANGIACGLRRRGETTWHTIPAAPPVGTRLPGKEDVTPLAAIGDSVLVDFCGLGGMLDAPPLRESLLDPESGIVDARRIEASGSPCFNLGIIDAAGVDGLIGRGSYRPDDSLFKCPKARRRR